MRAAILATLLVAAVGCIQRPEDVPGTLQSAPAAFYGSLVGQPSPRQELFFENRGEGRTVALGPAVIVGEGASSFEVTADGCVGKRLFGDERCVIDIRFTAAAVTTVEAEVRIEAAYDGPLVTRLVGTGVAPVDFARTNIAIANPDIPYVGDLNGDGKRDIATSSSNGVAMLINTTPQGDLAPIFTISTLASGRLGALVDVNGDDKPDIVSVLETTLSVALNLTTGGAATPVFDAPAMFSVPIHSTVVAEDFDVDARMDLVAASGTTGAMAVLMNQTLPGASAPTLTRHDLATAPIATAIAGFVDDDSKPDLVVTNKEWTVHALINTGSATPEFSTAVELPSSFGYGATHANVTDINRDGRNDVVFAYGGDLRVAMREDALTFVPTDLYVQYLNQGLIVVDLNGDGAGDLIATVGNYVVLHLNATPVGAMTAAFTGAIVLTAGAGATIAAAADVAGDSRLDLIVSNASENTMSVFVAR